MEEKHKGKRNSCLRKDTLTYTGLIHTAWECLGKQSPTKTMPPKLANNALIANDSDDKNYPLFCEMTDSDEYI